MCAFQWKLWSGISDIQHSLYIFYLSNIISNIIYFNRRKSQVFHFVALKLNRFLLNDLKIIFIPSSAWWYSYPWFSIKSYSCVISKWRYATILFIYKRSNIWPNTVPHVLLVDCYNNRTTNHLFITTIIVFSRNSACYVSLSHYSLVSSLTIQLRRSFCLLHPYFIIAFWWFLSMCPSKVGPY